MLPDDSVEALIAAADQALYRAKSNGRNRTESAVRGSRPAVA
jgi:PleD family two-component response regulator